MGEALFHFFEFNGFLIAFMILGITAVFTLLYRRLRFQYQLLMHALTAGKDKGPFCLCFFDQKKKIFFMPHSRHARVTFHHLNFRYYHEFLDLFQSHEQDEIRFAFSSLFSKHQPIALTLSTQENDQRYRVNAHCIPNNPNLILVTIHDVTVIEQEKQALRLEHKTLLSTIEMFKHTCDHLPYPLWIRSGKDLVYCNKLCSQLLNPEECHNTIVSIALLQKELLQGPQPRPVITNGERYFYHFTETTVGPDLYLGFGKDCTREHAIERKLHTHLVSYREVLETLSASVSIYDKDLCLSYYNHAYVRMFEFEESWLSHRPTLGEVLDDLRKRRLLTELPDYTAYKNEQIRRVSTLDHLEECLLHIPDGRIIRMIVAPHPLGGIFYIFEDITDALNLKGKYNTQLAVYDATLNNLFEGVAVFGSDNRLQISNTAFAQIWNLTPQQLRPGRHLSELAEEVKSFFDGNSPWQAYKARVMRQVTDRNPKKRRITRNDGSVLEFSYMPLPDGSHLMSYHDITDQSKMENILEERNDALIAANRLKSSFISNISYELRAPLSAIIGYTELLTSDNESNLGPVQNEYCKNILISSKRLHMLVTNILDLAMIEAGHIHLKKQLQNLGEIVKSVIENVTTVYPEYKDYIVFHDFHKAAYIFTDSKYLQQTFELLLLQSMQDFDVAHPIELTLAMQDNYAKVTIHIPKLKTETLLYKEAAISPWDDKISSMFGVSLAQKLINLNQGTFHYDTTADAFTARVCLPLTNVQPFERPKVAA